MDGTVSNCTGRLQGYISHFQMRLAIAKHANPITSAPMSIDNELAAIASIAVQAFVDDVRALVREQFTADLPDWRVDDASSKAWVASRKADLLAWLSEAHPLTWGSHQSTFARVVRIVTEKPVDIGKGIAPSARGKCSIGDFVNICYKGAISDTLRNVRPPLWTKGSAWPVLRTAVAESKIRLSNSLSDKEHEDQIKAALADAVRVARINFFPDSAVAGHRDPSYLAWTIMGESDASRRRLNPDNAVSVTERLSIQLAQASQAAMSTDVNAPWSVADVEIQAYHLCIKRECLPDDYSIAAAQVDSAGDLVKQSYNWADMFLKRYPIDWRSKLAKNLAFLISKMTPNVFADKDDVNKAKAELTQVSANNRLRVGIELARAMRWVSRPQNGTTDSAQYYSQAAIFFLCWIHDKSPLRVEIDRPSRPNAGVATWLSKHSE